MTQPATAKIILNDIEVDFNGLRLYRQEKWHTIEAKPLGLLKLLMDNQGQAVSRQQIMDALWQDTVVSDNSISQLVAQLRKALGDDKGTPEFIRTVPRVGYQLIANIEVIQPINNKTQPLEPKSNKIPAVTLIAAALVIISAFILLNWFSPAIELQQYQYASRLTSIPGPESFLRYSPNGRYLAFNQSAENRKNMDLAVYDSKTESIHSIKTTGYNEQAPEWSPDGKWLIYYRHDPLSCGIRIMSVANPVETWRLSPDFHLHPCDIDHKRDKMHWVGANQLFIISFVQNQPRLTELTLALEPRPKVTKVKHFDNIQPQLLDIDKNHRHLLYVEQQTHWHQLKHLALDALNREEKATGVMIEQSRQNYWGLKWQPQNDSFWIGQQTLRLMNLKGQSKTIQQHQGYIADLDINPINNQLAHAEGTLNINLYGLTLKQSIEQSNIKRLSSSARSDILPMLSPDGQQLVFISYLNQNSQNAKPQQRFEVWLKHRYKQAASLITNLAQDIHPKYLLWSPDSKNILLGDSDQRLHLINLVSKHLVTIVSDYKQVNSVNWSTDSNSIVFNAQGQNWQYQLQLASIESAPQRIEPNIKQHNSSYPNYSQTIAKYLTQQLADERPVDNLYPSLALYQPAITQSGIYYIVRQGHQLNLFLYQFESKQNQYLGNIGQYQLDTTLKLSLSASNSINGSETELVYSKIEEIETDILLQRAVETTR